jgi:predicted ArsR family transcriptional regulator
MAPMKEETRTLIRQLYFVDQVPLADIAEALGLSPNAVRRALLLRGGVRRRVIGPFTKENDS